MRALLDPLGRVFLLAGLVFLYYAGTALSLLEPQTDAAATCARFGVPLLIAWWAEHDSIDRTLAGKLAPKPV